MKPLEVFFLDDNFDRLTGSIPYNVLVWTRRYYDVGEFMMEIPSNQYNPAAKFVYADDRPETAIIQKVEVIDSDYNAEDSVGIDIIRISGFFLEAWLNDFVFLIDEKVEEVSYKEIPYPVYTGFRGFHTQATKPEIATDEDGNTYVVKYSKSSTTDDDGTHLSLVKTYYSTETREIVGSEYYSGYDEGKTTGTVPKVVKTQQVKPGLGMTSIVANAAEDTMGTPEQKKFKQAYCVDYTTQDGQQKIEISLPTGVRSALADGGHVTTTGDRTWTYDVLYADKSGGRNGGVSIYQDENGDFRYVTGSVRHISTHYARLMEKWELNARREGVVKHTLSDDGLSIDSAGLWETKYRTVAGSYVVHNTVDLIGKEKDNAQGVMDYARRLFGNNILFDTIPIEGEVKVIDPSLQRFGDFAFQELQTIEASIQLTYSYMNNSFVLSIWRGVDRTQSQTENPWAVFSDTWGTLYGYSASIDDSNYRNKCYVMYDYEAPTAFVTKELAERSNGQLFAGQPMYMPIMEKYFDDTYAVRQRFVGFKIPYETKHGYETVRLDDGQDFDKETYLDLRDEVPSCDADWSRDYVLATDAETYGAILGEQNETEQVEYLSQGMDATESGLEWDDFIEGYDMRIYHKVSTYDPLQGFGGFMTEYRYFAPRLDESTAELKDLYSTHMRTLQERGRKHLLDNYSVVTNLDTGILVKDGYLTQWDLGDKVDMSVSTLDAYIETRIVEVVETHASGSSTVEITLGDQLTTQTERANLV